MAEAREPYLDRAQVRAALRALSRGVRELTARELDARHALERGDATKRSRVRELARTREALREAHAEVQEIDLALVRRERRLERVKTLLGSAHPPTVSDAHEAEASRRAELAISDKLVARVEAKLEEARSNAATPHWKRERLEHVVERAQARLEAAQLGLQSVLDSMRLLDEVREDARRAGQAYRRALSAYPELLKLLG